MIDQTASFKAGLKMLEEIRAAAKEGDTYAKELLALYDACNPAVVWMPWPKKEKAGK